MGLVKVAPESRVKVKEIALNLERGNSSTGQGVSLGPQLALEGTPTPQKAAKYYLPR